jgi:hypothetical protein
MRIVLLGLPIVLACSGRESADTGRERGSGAAASSMTQAPNAPETIKVPSTPACNSCSIEVVRLATIGERSGDGSLERVPRVVVGNSRGGVAVFAGRIPQLFDSGGRYQRMIARAGKGPGELAAPWGAVFDAADSLHVFDIDGSQLTTFTPAFAFVRSVHTTPTANLTFLRRLPNGSFVARGDVGGAGHHNRPIHILSPLGVIVRSFGLPDQAAAPASPQGSRGLGRRIAVGNDGTIWAGHVQEYVLDQYDSAGRLLGVLALTPPWFPGPSGDWTPQVTNPPPADLWRVAVDAEGLLWTFTHVPRTNWKAGVTPSKTAGQFRFDGHRAYDTMIEVLDPLKGHLLASRRLDGYVIDVFGHDRMVTYQEGSDDIPRITVHRLRLVR